MDHQLFPLTWTADSHVGKLTVCPQLPFAIATFLSANVEFARGAAYYTQFFALLGFRPPAQAAAR
jgi:hypothetical protein